VGVPDWVAECYGPSGEDRRAALRARRWKPGPLSPGRCDRLLAPTCSSSYFAVWAANFYSNIFASIGEFGRVTTCLSRSAKLAGAA
jgi:hypothetical protein